jgi:hypothetical protein
MAAPSRQSGSSFGSSQKDDAHDQKSFVDLVKNAWQKTGLDRPTILLMMK